MTAVDWIVVILSIAIIIWIMANGKLWHRLIACVPLVLMGIDMDSTILFVGGLLLPLILLYPAVAQENRANAERQRRGEPFIRDDEDLDSPWFAAFMTVFVVAHLIGLVVEWATMWEGLRGLHASLVR